MVTTHSSIDGLDCITADNIDEEPVQICDDSSDPMGDSDLSESASADKAVIPSRDDQGPPHFAVASVDLVTLRAPGTIRIPLLTVHCFYCLHEHIRERAPPPLS